MIGRFFRMVYQPGTGWNPPVQIIASAWRGLLSGRTLRVPDAAFARRRIVAFGDIQPGVSMSMEIGTILVILAVMPVAFSFVAFSRFIFTFICERETRAQDR
jgi:hypothetical protein